MYHIKEELAPVLIAQNLTVDYFLEDQNHENSLSGRKRARKKTAGAGVNPVATKVRALTNINLQILPGSSLSIMGPSGSGKTTLLHTLAGIQEPSQGRVLYKMQDLFTMPDSSRTILRRKDFGFVFQSGQLIDELSAEENVALPLMLSGLSYEKAIPQAHDWLARVGLQSMESHRPGEMSGGQRQRVAIARALIINPSVVFADEPTGALDQATGERVITLLTSWCAKSGASLIVVTHDPHVANFCQNCIHMQDGRIIS